MVYVAVLKSFCILVVFAAAAACVTDVGEPEAGLEPADAAQSPEPSITELAHQDARMAAPKLACADDYARQARRQQTSFPVRVVIDPTMREENVEAALAAVELWNREMGAQVFAATSSADKQAGCGWVSIGADAELGQLLGFTEWNACRATMTVRPELWGTATDKATLTIAHELGHALNVPHEHATESLMHDTADHSQGLHLSALTKCWVGLALADG